MKGWLAMPPKGKYTLPEQVRRAALDDLLFARDAARLSEENFKIGVYLKTQQGLTQVEIATSLGLAQSVVSAYRQQGLEAYERRRRTEASDVP